MECTVNRGHRFVRVLFQYFGILRSFEFVEQLATEHYIEVFDEAGGYVGYCHFLVLIQGFAVLLVENVGVDNVLNGRFGRDFEQLLLSINRIPVIDQTRLEVIGNLDFDFHFGDKLLFGFNGARVEAPSLFSIKKNYY